MQYLYSAIPYILSSDYSDAIIIVVVFIVIFSCEYYRTRNLQKSTHKINSLLGAPFTPHFYRPLRQEEIDKLKGQKLTLNEIAVVTTIVIFISVCILVLLVS